MTIRKLERIMRDSAHINVPFQQTIIDVASHHLPERQVHQRARRGWLRVALSSVTVGLVGAFSFVIAMTSQVKAIVTVDINPGISLSINGFNRVKTASGITADADAFLAGVSINGLTIAAAVDEIYQHAYELGIVEANDVSILIGISADDADTEANLTARLSSYTFDSPWNTVFFNRHVVIDERLYAGTVYEDSRFSGTDISPEFASDQAAIAAENDIPEATTSYVRILSEAMTETLLKDLALLHGISETKMAIVIYVAITSGAYQSEAEFAALASMPVSELITLYETLS